MVFFFIESRQPLDLVLACAEAAGSIDATLAKYLKEKGVELRLYLSLPYELKGHIGTEFLICLAFFVSGTVVVYKIVIKNAVSVSVSVSLSAALHEWTITGIC